MEILIILFGVGFVAVIVWVWYYCGVSDAQEAYDNELEKIAERFNDLRMQPLQNNSFERMGSCIVEADNIIANMAGTNPQFILNKVKKKNDAIRTMYEELLKKLYKEFDQAFTKEKDVTNTFFLIRYMQDSVQFVSDPNSFGFAKVIADNTDKIQQYYTAIQVHLHREFMTIGEEFSLKTSYDVVLDLMKRSIERNKKFKEYFEKSVVKPKDDNSKQIARMITVCNAMEKLQTEIRSSNYCYMISENDYGKCDETFLDSVKWHSIDASYMESQLRIYERAFEYGSLETIVEGNLRELAQYVWYFAFLKPFSSEAFEKVCKLYNAYLKNAYTVEVLLATLYYKKQMGADAIIRNNITDFLDERNGTIRDMIKCNVVIDKIGDKKVELAKVICESAKLSNEKAEKIVKGHTSIVVEGVDYSQANAIVYDLNKCGAFASIQYQHNSSCKLLTTMASGLMWMGAYDAEKQVLEYMLSKQLPLSQKQQERIHALNNRGDNAPKSYALSSDDNVLYFDISSITWRDDEYKGFFENLAFEEKILSYSIAVRDEDKELLIGKKISVPGLDSVVDKIKEGLEDEYGETVKATIRSCCALSGINKEEMKGILVQPRECSQLGILVCMTCIGKKVTIKFFTLFMPNAKELAEQRQQLLSLYKKMSPSVVMWESSLKDTILVAFQQLFNELPSTNVAIAEQNEVEF